MSSVTRDPALAQSALKGNVITFPQNVSEIARSLPLSPSLLPDLIKIIFVGSIIPSRLQMRSILTVRREIVRHALIWLQTNNILYTNVVIDHLAVNDLPIDDIPNTLWNTISTVHQSESNNIERSGYADNDIVSEETSPDGAIPLAVSALMDTIGLATSSDDIMKHLLSRINANKDGTDQTGDVFLVPHGPHPVNEYFNTTYLPGM